MLLLVAGKAKVDNSFGMHSSPHISKRMYLSFKLLFLTRFFKRRFGESICMELHADFFRLEQSIVLTAIGSKPLQASDLSDKDDKCTRQF